MGHVYNLPFSPSTGDGGNLQPKFRGDRLAELMAAAKLSQSELGRRVGVSQATVWKLLNEPMQGSKYLHKIAEELGTTAAYLMGESEEAKGESPGKMDGTIEIEEYSLAELASEERRAGSVVRPFSSAWLAHITKCPVENLVVVRELGDGMNPTIQNADSVFLDRSINAASVGDELFAIRRGGAAAIRRLRPRGSQTIIMSDKPTIRDDTAETAELEILGRVVAVLRPI